jgi:hypothetical protein
MSFDDSGYLGLNLGKICDLTVRPFVHLGGLSALGGSQYSTLQPGWPNPDLVMNKDGN